MSITLNITVVSAQDLKNVEASFLKKDAKSDPYTSLSIGNQKFRTKVIDNSLNPIWNESFAFKLSSTVDDSQKLIVRVSDYEKVGLNRLLGQVEIPLGFLAKKDTHEGTYSLREKDNSPGEGQIKLLFKYDDPARKAAVAAASAAASSSSAYASSAANDISETEGETTADDEGSDFEAEGAADPLDPLAPKRRIRRKKTKAIRKLSNKPMDYQIRVSIIEGRSLQGLGSLDPVVKVSCSRQTKQTRIKKSTNNPFYNELFFFSFFQSPAVLFDDTIEISAFNSRRLRKDALIGSFKFDIGMVYDEPGHMLERKWVMLTDPKDRGKGPQGYVKMTVMVLGPGDEVPLTDTVVYNADEDVTENLVCPPGVEPDVIHLAVKVYAAEDLPQMDHSFKSGFKKLDNLTGQSKKQFCDPYTIVSFAGNKIKTDIHENTYFPVFNQELRLPMQVPSMCDKIRIQLVDSDLGVILNPDDVIGTHHLALSNISMTDPDRGFYPMFGPSWITLYGAPREFESFESEHAENMNKGLVDGCAYRGRVLVQVSQFHKAEAIEPGTEPEEKVEPRVELQPADESEVQQFLRRRLYTLRAVFLEGTMIFENAYKDAIEFEVSIGNVGNKFDVEAQNAAAQQIRKDKEKEKKDKDKDRTEEKADDIVSLGSVANLAPPSISTTQPEYAVHDGHFHHHMPWESRKPCIELQSEWEDVMYRFESLNRVKSIIRHLTEGVDAAAAKLDELVRISENEAAAGKLPSSTSSTTPLSAIAASPTSSSSSSANLASPAGPPLSSPVPSKQLQRLTPTGADLNGTAHPLLQEMLLKTLSTLVMQASMPLSPLPAVSTKLDEAMRKWREEEKQEAIAVGQQLQAELLASQKTPLEVIEALRDTIACLSYTAVESQESIPDVIIWMISNRKRLAYARFPVSQIMYSDLPDSRGQYFGTAQSVVLQSPKKDPKKLTESVIPGHLQVKLWFGPTASEPKWRQHNLGGNHVVLAEAYQNQRYFPLKGWTEMMLPVDPPVWSDKRGKEARQPDKVRLPEGWQWLGEWQIDAEMTDIDVEAGMESVIEESYENQRYYPLKGWGNVMKTDRFAWSDITGTEERSKDKIELKQGWLWQNEWEIDRGPGRAVDDSGWEYAVDFPSKYYPTKKTMHFVRRRRWVRTRARDPHFDFSKINEAEKTSQMRKEDEGWQYAIDFGKKYRSEPRKLDTVRRRRWRRERVLINPQMQIEDSAAFGSDDLLKSTFASGVCVSYKEFESFQLRAHIYQARDLIGEDKSGLSDPYVRICFSNRSATTMLKEQTICPMWDQTLVLDDMRLYGSLSDIMASVPEVKIEVFDYDKIGGHDFLGRTTCKPVFRSASIREIGSKPPKLHWIPLSRIDQSAGELLVAFELIPSKDIRNFPISQRVPMKEDLTNKRHQVRRVPDDVRPKLERCRVEILTWGLRQMKKYRLLSVNTPHVEFECNGQILNTEKLKSLEKFPNFNSPFLAFDVDLPVEEIYAPPLNIRVFDNRKFGRKPMIGSHSVSSLARYRRTSNAPDRIYEVDTGAGVGAFSSTTTPLSSTVIQMGSSNQTVHDEEDDSAPLMPIGAVQMKVIPASPSRDTAGYASGMDSDGEGFSSDGMSDVEDYVSPEQENELEDSAVDWWTKFHASVAIAHAPPATLVNTAPVTQNVIAKSKRDRLAEGANQIASGASQALGAFSRQIGWKKSRKLKREERILNKTLKSYHGDLMEIYREELEMHFNFSDTLETFPLSRGRAESDDTSECGRFKGNFRIYPIASSASLMEKIDPSALGKWLGGTVPSNSPVDVVVRVYVVRGIDLQACDDNGKSDPYCIVALNGPGKKVIKDRDNYVPATLNPTFGKMFEMEATLPINNEVTVTVMDWDAISADDLIGETRIDVESRYLSSTRGTLGVAPSYTKRGVSKWRDSQRPSEILDEWCKNNGFPRPIFDQNPPFGVTIPTLKGGSFVGDVNTHLEEYKSLDEDSVAFKRFRHQNAAVKALRALGLVPEHVESRKLINPMMPDIEQGKLQMWVDIIPKSLGDLKPPVNIAPRKATKYELRIVIWNTKDVDFADVSITGEKMSDIYVKGFLRGLEKDKQKTDIHYRSLNGESMHNWRIKLPLSYIPAEDVMIIEQKAHFYSLDKETIKLPPLLAIQVWDNDLFKPDDYIGSVDLNLSHLIPFEKKARNVKFPDEYPADEFFSIFEHKHVRGWIPVMNGAKAHVQPTANSKIKTVAVPAKTKKSKKGSKKEEVKQETFWMSGKVELEIELLTEAEALEKPNAQGRSEPNNFPVLEKPNRPATSFLWFLSPWKSFRYVLWKAYKWWFLLFITLALIALALFIFFYNFPNYISRRIVIGQND